jgi:hypothetical protein
MTWISRHKRNLRITLLILMLLAIIGPWVFDLINVPAKYTCAPPNYRLHDDFCGMALSGLWVLWGSTAEFIRSAWMLVTGQDGLASIFRVLAISLFDLLIVLPVVSTLLVCLRDDNRRLVVFHMLICGLAAGAGLLMGLNSYPRLFYVVWGVWLFVLATASAVILEVLLMRNRKNAGQVG